MSSSILTNRNGIITEKGTWTPVVSKLFSYQTLPTYDTIQSYATYYRIGKICYVSCWLYIDITNAGNANISVDGLPYTSSESSTNRYQIFASDAGHVTNHTRYGSVAIYDNNTKVTVFKHETYDAVFQKYEIGETKIGFSGCYIINSSYGG